MPTNALQTALSKELSGYTGTEVVVNRLSPVAGGSINRAFRIHTSKGDFFLKLNEAVKYPGMFEVEARGLKLLEHTCTVSIPKVISCGVIGQEAFLLMEFLEGTTPENGFFSRLGNALAGLHRNTAKDFGLDHDNYLGSLSQKNSLKSSWGDFLIENRLEPLVKIARDQGELSSSDLSAFNRCYRHLDSYFPEEPPSLLHGDFWNGNYLCGPDHVPYIFDPAVYYGHREMDLAMSLLFGGFPRDFYDSYHDTFPLEKGWQERTEVANLYPLLVHVILFGGGYAAQIRRVLRQWR